MLFLHTQQLIKRFHESESLRLAHIWHEAVVRPHVPLYARRAGPGPADQAGRLRPRQTSRASAGSPLSRTYVT